MIPIEKRLPLTVALPHLRKIPDTLYYAQGDPPFEISTDTVRLDADIIAGFTNRYLLEGYDVPTAIPDVHFAAWELVTSPYPHVAIAAPRDHAKACTLDEPVLTSSGWTTIGALKVGDSVIGSDGFPTKVTGLSPVTHMKLYRMTTKSGRSARCSADHLWTVTCPSNTGGRPITKTLESIALNYRAPRIDKRHPHLAGSLEYRYYIHMGAPVQFPTKQLPIDPYTLGLWLGDGDSDRGWITTPDMDSEIYSYVPYKSYRKSYGGCPRWKIEGLTTKLRESGLLKNKHIPEMYLRADVNQREALLQGLMDSDGHAPKGQRRTEWCSVRKELTDNYVELVRSLGGKANICRTRAKIYDKDYGFCYKVIAVFPEGISPFRLSRKLLAWGGPKKIKEAIVAIEEAGEGLGRCIKVAAEDGLYITTDYLPTHNTTSVTLAYVLAEVLFKCSDHVALISDTENQASMFLQDITRELQENTELIADFGVLDFLRLTLTEIVAQLVGGHKFRIIAKGAEQRIRGMKWDNKRPNLIVLDDCESDEAVESQDRRIKFRRWFYNALIPAGSARCKIRMVGTVMHFDSLLYRLVKDPNWVGVCFRAHDDDFKNILWPDRWPEERLKELRRVFGQQNNLSGYSREYLNEPVDEEDAYFRREWFRHYSELPGNLTYYICSDFAVSTKEQSDYSVFAVVGVAENGDWYLIDIHRGHWDSKEIIEKIFLLHKRYDPMSFLVEDGLIWKAMAPIVNTESMRRMSFPRTVAVSTAGKDKMTRARALQHRMQMGRLLLDPEARWYDDLYFEMVRFPKGPKDDQVDALSHLGMYLESITYLPKWCTEEGPDVDPATLTSLFAWDKDSVNPITGY